MSQEISVSTTLSATKGYLTQSRTASTTPDMTGSRFTARVQSVGTTHEVLDIGADVGIAGWAFFRNLDTTNYCELGLDNAGTFTPFAKFKAGAHGVVPLATKNIYARANTSATNLEFVVLED